jgi:PAS domain S-box-containing protein
MGRMKNKTSSLRKRAEEFLDKNPESIKEITSGDVKKLVEDLHVHQIELEIQNEELRRLVSEFEKSETTLKQAKALLKDEAIRRRILVEQSRDGIVVLDQNGKVFEANQRFANMLGYSMEEILQLHVWDWVTQKTQEQLLEMARTVDETGDHFETRHCRKDGTFYDVEVSTNGAVCGGQRLVFYVCRDITERMEVVQNLRDALIEIKELKNRLEAEKAYLQEEIKLKYNYENIIGNSDEIRYTLYKVEQIASTDTTVIILGETGSGKELIARAIHGSSSRKNRAFVKVNCATLPLSLIESELFGHERGAFSGAFARRLGRFEVANGATLFLDEIGEMPLELQTKLLRVIQDGEFERLGSSQTIKVDVRIIAATNRNLEEEVRNGRFRKDLWYRLNIFPITVPPLRNRMEDLPLLVEFIVDKVSKKLGKYIDYIPKSVMNTLQNYHWPGNIRELENVIERSVINSSAKKLRLMDSLDNPQKDLATTPKTLEKVERDHIVRILEETRWKVSGKNGASEILGLNPSTLRARMRKLGIRKP